MDINRYRELYGDGSGTVPGWDAIDSRLKELYGSQEPRHWGTLVKAMLGGPDPLDGISMVEFIQAFGITSGELAALMAKSRSCREIFEGQQRSNPLLVTDLARRDG